MEEFIFIGEFATVLNSIGIIINSFTILYVYYIFKNNK